jgi:hypothetical protein
MRRDAAGAEHHLHFRTEGDAAVEAGVVQRLDPELVAGDDQAVPLAVVDHDREHAVQRLREVRAALLVQVDEHFRVRVRLETVAATLELRAQLAVVVDLAVEEHTGRAFLVEDGLVAGGEVDDGEAPHAQREATLHQVARVVGTPVRHGVAHALDHVLVRRGTFPGRNAGYATHQETSSSRRWILPS